MAHNYLSRISSLGIRVDEALSEVCYLIDRGIDGYDLQCLLLTRLRAKIDSLLCLKSPIDPDTLTELSLEFRLAVVCGETSAQSA